MLGEQVGELTFGIGLSTHQIKVYAGSAVSLEEARRYMERMRESLLQWRESGQIRYEIFDRIVVQEICNDSNWPGPSRPEKRAFQYARLNFYPVPLPHAHSLWSQPMPRCIAWNEADQSEMNPGGMTDDDIRRAEQAMVFLSQDPGSLQDNTAAGWVARQLRHGDSVHEREQRRTQRRGGGGNRQGGTGIRLQARQTSGSTDTRAGQNEQLQQQGGDVSEMMSRVNLDEQRSSHGQSGGAHLVSNVQDQARHRGQDSERRGRWSAFRLHFPRSQRGRGGGRARPSKQPQQPATFNRLRQRRAMSTSNTQVPADKPADPYTAKNKEEPSLQEKIGDLIKFIEDRKFCMMTTRIGSNGLLVSRCMALAGKEGNGVDLIFHANTESGKTDDLASDPKINLSFLAPSGEWASLSGEASVETDREKVRKFYSPALKAWIGDLGDGKHDGGPEDPRICVIKVNAVTAQYAIASRSSVGGFVEFAKGVATGEAPSVNKLRYIDEQDLKKWRSTNAQL
ncbi:MAG: hypothetical protein Q9159_007256 [Coniocarpon cinnabarinum]